MKLAEAARKLIVITLEETIKLPYSSGKYLPPPPYDRFTNLVISLRQSGRNECSIITFNYDLALDYAFHFAGVPINYIIPDNDLSASVKVHKLHGSLNWGRCIECNKIIPWHLKDYFAKYQFNPYEGTKYGTLKLGNLLQNCFHCGKALQPDAVIVPPTWNKAQYKDDLGSIWESAALCMGEAENIFIIGYSLPETDQFFKFLFALGTISRTPIRRLWIFNPADDEVISERYNSMFAKGIKQKYVYYKKTFEGSINIIENEILR